MSGVQKAANCLLWGMVGLFLQPIRAQPVRQVATVGAGIAIVGNLGPGPNPATRRPGHAYVGVVREFGIPELTSKALAFSGKAVAVSVSALSFDGYRQTNIVAAMTGNISLTGMGVRLGLDSAAIDGYTGVKRLHWTAGLIRPVSQQTFVGAIISSQELGMGVAVKALPGVVAIDFFRATNGTAGMRLAWIIEVSPALELRGGLASDPTVMGIGFRLVLGQTVAETGFSRHESLGMSQSWGFSWLF